MASLMATLGIDRLGAPERLALIEEIWHSLSGEHDVLVPTAEQRQELERRGKTSEAGLVSWEAVRNATPPR